MRSMGSVLEPLTKRGLISAFFVVAAFWVGVFFYYADDISATRGITQSMPWLFDTTILRSFVIIFVAYVAWVWGAGGGSLVLLATLAMLWLHSSFAVTDVARTTDNAYLVLTGVGAGVAVVAFSRWGEEHNNRKHEQALLVASESRYRALMEHSPEGIFLLDAEHNLLAANPKASVITGYSRDELVGMNVRRLLRPDDTPKAALQAFQEGFGHRETSVVRKDGTEFLGEVAITGFEMEGQRVAMGILRDVTEERRLQDEVKARERELAESEQVNRAVVQYASEAIFLADSAGIFLEVNLKACQLTGYSREEFLGMRTTQLLRPNDPHRPLAQAVAEGLYQRELALVRKDGSAFLAAVTLTDFDLRNQHVVLGIVRDVTEERRLQAEILAGKQALEEGYRLHLHSLGLALAARNPYTHGHGQRVREYAVAVARRLGLPGERITVMGLAAELHDYGKIGVSDAVLLKPGPLTPPEWAEIRRHPELSVSLIEHIPFLQEAIPIIRAHHEKVDGSGYPDALRGEAIPIEARIISVVDVYDALTTERSYRRAYSHEDALAILREETGSKWDPQVVRTFFEVIDDWVKPRTEEQQSRRTASSSPAELQN